MRQRKAHYPLVFYFGSKYLAWLCVIRSMSFVTTKINCQVLVRICSSYIPSQCRCALVEMPQNLVQIHSDCGCHMYRIRIDVTHTHHCRVEPCYFRDSTIGSCVIGILGVLLYGGAPSRLHWSDTAKACVADPSRRVVLLVQWVTRGNANVYM